MCVFQQGWKNLELLRKMIPLGLEKLDAFDCFYSSPPTTAFECLQPTLPTKVSEHCQPTLPYNALECFRRKGNIYASFLKNETKSNNTRQHEYISKKHQTIINLQHLEKKLYDTVKMLKWRRKRQVDIEFLKVFM